MSQCISTNETSCKDVTMPSTDYSKHWHIKCIRYQSPLVGILSKLSLLTDLKERYSWKGDIFILETSEINSKLEE